MIRDGERTAVPLDVAIVRNDDLEARELFMFDALSRHGVIRCRAFGTRPSTPYGMAGLTIPVSVLPSVTHTLGRLPLGHRAGDLLEARLGRPVGHLLGFDRAIGADTKIINTRETFQPSSLLACRYRTSHPNTRVVVSVFENIAFRYEDSPVLARVKDEVRDGADLFVANSPEARQALELEGVPPDRVRVIVPGIDTDRFCPGPPAAAMRAQWQVTEDQVAIVYAGRLIREKGLVELVTALAPLLRASPPDGPVLVLHGAGPEEPRLRRAAAALGVAQAVRFSGWTETHRMPEVYRSADLVVMPSLPTPYWTEQFGFNLVEAMACGRAVLSTRSGSIPSVVGTAAVLVPPYDPGALAAEVTRLVEDAASREELGGAARRLALDTYAVDRAGQQLVDAFDEVLSWPPRPAAAGPTP